MLLNKLSRSYFSLLFILLLSSPTCKKMEKIVFLLEGVGYITIHRLEQGMDIPSVWASKTGEDLEAMGPKLGRKVVRRRYRKETKPLLPLPLCSDFG